MTKNVKKYHYGLIIMVPLVISMLFMGIHNISNASQDNELDLNQSEVGIPQPAQIWLWLFIDGKEIEGDSIVASLEREGKTQIWSFRHDVSVETDLTGLSGKKTHSPIVMTKQIDKISPLLFKALMEDELVNSATFRFYRAAPGGGGAEELYYTITLENAHITKIRTFTLADISSHYDFYLEEITHVFEKIIWTYNVNGATYQDVIGGE